VTQGNYYGNKKDRRAGQRQSLPELVSSADKRNLHYPTGHMGAAVSSDSLKRLWPQISNWLAERDN
jgi:hypothetical protein